jgi:putative tryptophan/tyrosine transport system substrate-binding protein
MPDVRRRELIALLGGAAATWPVAARAQQRRHVGVLMGTTGDAQGQAMIGGFRAALETLGRRDVDLDVRWSGANIDRIRADATDLANAKPDLIMVYSVRVLNAARQATGPIPVVFIATSDPVGLGLVDSLARPGGNLTGFMVYEVSLAGKLVEILKETAPQVARVGLVFNPENLSAAGYQRSIVDVAKTLDIAAVWLAVRDAMTIDAALTEFGREPGSGLVLPVDLTTIAHRDLIIALAARHRLPAIYSDRADAVRGGMMSYGPDATDLFRRAASYVDRILKGEKPSDLPVQAPSKFEFVINLKTAKALGLEVPPTLLARADEVIE